MNATLSNVGAFVWTKQPCLILGGMGNLENWKQSFIASILTGSRSAGSNGFSSNYVRLSF